MTGNNCAWTRPAGRQRAARRATRRDERRAGGLILRDGLRTESARDGAGRSRESSSNGWDRFDVAQSERVVALDSGTHCRCDTSCHGNN